MGGTLDFLKNIVPGGDVSKYMGDYNLAYENVVKSGTVGNAPDWRDYGVNWGMGGDEKKNEEGMAKYNQDLVTWSGNFRTAFVQEFTNLVAAKTGSSATSAETINIVNQVLAANDDKVAKEALANTAAQQGTQGATQTSEEQAGQAAGAVKGRGTAEAIDQSTVLTSSTGVEGNDVQKRKTLLGG